MKSIILFASNSSIFFRFSIKELYFFIPSSFQALASQQSVAWAESKYALRTVAAGLRPVVAPFCCPGCYLLNSPSSYFFQNSSGVIVLLYYTPIVSIVVILRMSSIPLTIRFGVKMNRVSGIPSKGDKSLTGVSLRFIICSFIPFNGVKSLTLSLWKRPRIVSGMPFNGVRFLMFLQKEMFSEVRGIPFKGDRSFTRVL